MGDELERACVVVEVSDLRPLSDSQRALVNALMDQGRALCETVRALRREPGLDQEEIDAGAVEFAAACRHFIRGVVGPRMPQ